MNAALARRFFLFARFGDRLRIPFVAAFLAIVILRPAAAAAQVAADVAVQVSAAVQKTPSPMITLSWPSAGSPTAYTIYRKAPSGAAWGAPVASLPGSATSWADTSVAVGVRYEYWVSEQSSTVGQASGYVLSAIEAPLVESRGKVMLIVDATFSTSLAAELARLEQDLAGDGWLVIRHDVAPSDTVPSVKALIVREYQRDPANVRSVFLFGHVPVPYAGATAPDGHGNHYGAWPADLYYGDIDGVWTDVQNYDSTVAGRQHNVAGDGKFDETSAPSTIDLEVGRVDLSNMPAFAPKTELDLLRQYLNKDHAFRHGLVTAQRRGLIDDNFGYFGGEAFASSGWRNFAAFFGAANVHALDWFTTLATQSYLWAYGCGGGSFTGAGGVGSTSNFATTDTQTIFTMLFGSYFGDWDTQNNFLRAPLATTTYGLIDAWSGRPVWYFHSMGLGETAGFGARLTQNNSGLYWGAYGPAIHVALMGDPTLRMHVVVPASSLIATPSGGNVALQWTASTDSVAGYDVYRSPSPRGPFTRVNGALLPAATTTFTDATLGALPGGTYTLAVRAVKLETSGSGSYFNPSQAIFADAAGGGAAAGSDLAVGLFAAPATVVTGSAVVYTVEVENLGPSDASGVQWSLPMSAGVSAVSVAPAAGCAVTAALVTCSPGMVPRGGTLSYLVTTTAAGAGTRVATATVSGSPADPSPANNSASATVTVVANAATSTVLSSSLNPSTFGQSVTFTATVTSSAGGAITGTVAFRDGAASIGSAALGVSGQAVLSTSALSLGSHSITASYGGSSTFTASASPIVGQSVKATTATALTSSRNPAIVGQVVTFTAAVTSPAGGAPSGTVSFLDGGTTIGSAALDATGHATFSTFQLSAAAHSIQASYPGDASYNPSVSATLSQSVVAASGTPTATSLASSSNPSAVGQPVTFTATVTAVSGSPTGTVTFLVGVQVAGSAAVGGTGQAALTLSNLPPGSNLVRASYGGDSTFAPSDSPSLVQTVKNSTTLSLASSVDPSAPGARVVLTATVVPGVVTSTFMTGTVAFSDGATVLATTSVNSLRQATYSTMTLSTATHRITASYAGDTLFSPSASGVLTQVVTPAWNRADFSGDQKADLLWRSASTGQAAVWVMTGTSASSVVPLPTVSDPQWELSASADFNGDGKADLVWRNVSNGLNGIWLMNGTSVSSVVPLAAQPDTQWRIVAAADMDADGKPDLLWRNVATGQLAIWLMNGTTPASVVALPTVSDTTWEIAGVGDFDGDGSNDIVWRNRVTGLNGVWLMNGVTVRTVVPLTTVSDASWRIVAIADYDQDGRADLVWRNSVNGLNGIWLMNGLSVRSIVALPAVQDPAWRVAGPK